MLAKKPQRTIEFAQEDEVFLKKLAGDIGCYCSKVNERTYSLNKLKTGVQGKRGAFAWVHKESHDYFWVSTRKVWVDQAKLKALAGKNAAIVNSFPRDIQQAEDSVCFDTRADYSNAVTVLGLIKKIR